MIRNAVLVSLLGILSCQNAHQPTPSLEIKNENRITSDQTEDPEKEKIEKAIRIVANSVDMTMISSLSHLATKSELSEAEWKAIMQTLSPEARSGVRTLIEAAACDGHSGKDILRRLLNAIGEKGLTYQFACSAVSGKVEEIHPESLQMQCYQTLFLEPGSVSDVALTKLNLVRIQRNNGPHKLTHRHLIER